MKVLVVGSPRSGTRYLAALLCKAGLDVGHERLGVDGCVSSYLTMDDDHYHGPHSLRGERRASVAADEVWHLVRHPLDVIGSLASWISRRWWQWQERHTGISAWLDPPAERAARFWLDWTQRADAQASLRCCVEDVATQCPEIVHRLGISGAMPELSKEIGKKPRAERVRLDVFGPELRSQIQHRAAAYGYSLS